MAMPTGPVPRRVTLVAAILLVAVWGLAAGLWTPRGPATTAQALASLAISLAVGLLAGWLSRSRWAMVLAPLAFAATVEVVRWESEGPTVDGVHVSAMGVVAFLSGRGLHGLLALLPLLVGAAYGAGLARRGSVGGMGGGGVGVGGVGGVAGSGGRVRRYLGRAVVGLLAAVLVLVTVGVALPARTDPITGADGRPKPGSIAELTSVRAGAGELGLMIRGADSTAPVLLFLPGPPGGSEIGAVRRHLAALERHFVVATLDRRGGSKSYAAFEPRATLTLGSEVRDTVAVTDYLRDRFGQDQIYLMAHSGGTIPGVLAVEAHPELFRAYVGVGQVVSLRASDRIQYARTLAWARSTGRTALADQLTDQGRPPYADLYSYEPLLLNESAAFAFNHGGLHEGPAGSVENLGVPEYSMLDRVRVFSGIVDAYDALYPREQDVDLRTQVTDLEVPVYLVAGAHEVPGRTPIVEKWITLLRAPHKEIVVLESGGHRSMFQQPVEFVGVMTRVLAETRGKTVD